MSEPERAKCPKCGADVSRRAADYLACGAPVVACWTCKTWKSPDGMLHPSDACRIRERDARIAALELDRDRANQAGMDAVFAVAVICEKLGLPPDTPPAKVAEEVGQLREAERLLGCAHVALNLAVKWAARLWERWGNDEDHKVGKGLRALAGELPRYAPDTDGIHAFLREIAEYRNAREAAEAARGAGAESNTNTKARD